MMQDFIVAWVNNVGKDRFRVFDSLAEAERVYRGINDRGVLYISINSNQKTVDLSCPLVYSGHC